MVLHKFYRFPMTSYEFRMEITYTTPSQLTHPGAFYRSLPDQNLVLLVVLLCPRPSVDPVSPVRAVRSVVLWYTTEFLQVYVRNL